MTKLVAAAKKFVAEENGATMIEYGLIVALISLAAVAALGPVGDAIQANFESVQTEVENATN